MLQSVHGDAYKRGVGDFEEVAKLEVCNFNEGKNLLPGGDEVFLN